MLLERERGGAERDARLEVVLFDFISVVFMVVHEHTLLRQVSVLQGRLEMGTQTQFIGKMLFTHLFDLQSFFQRFGLSFLLFCWMAAHLDFKTGPQQIQLVPVANLPGDAALSKGTTNVNS